MSPCAFDTTAPRQQVASGTAPATGLVTIFRLVHTQGEGGAAITLNWKKSQGAWRGAS